MWFPGYGIFLFDAEDNYNAIQQGHILEKKRRASPIRKKGTFFFIFKEKGSIFSFSKGTFYAILILMYETSKVEPWLGLPLPTMRSILFDFVVNFIDTNCY